jgi:Fe-S oxidoreductase
MLKGLQALGFKPMVMPFAPNGKALHVHGFFKAFKRVAQKTHVKLRYFESLNSKSAQELL